MQQHHVKWAGITDDDESMFLLQSLVCWHWCVATEAKPELKSGIEDGCGGVVANGYMNNSRQD